MNYAEAQEEEIEVLKAIYMNDLEETEVKAAWSRTTDRGLRLHLRAPSDPENFVLLSIKLTATYPRTAPVLEVDGLSAFHERTQRRIDDIIQKRPAELLGEVMIHEIAAEIQEALEDAVIARQQGALPSLAVMNRQAEEAAHVLAQAAEEAASLRQREADEEEHRVLQQMVAEELKREKQRPSKDHVIPSATVPSMGHQEIVVFDRPVSIKTTTPHIVFTNVEIVTELSNSRNVIICIGKPRCQAGINPPLVLIKRIIMIKSREEIMELESLLETAQSISHHGFLNLYAYRIDRIDVASSRLTICGQYTDRENLYELLKLGTLHVSKARQFTVDILEALDFLHRNGVAHGSLTVRAVTITATPSLSPKLAEYGYAWLLREGMSTIPAKWQAPEEVLTTAAAKRKCDIWYLGIVVLQMFLGLEVLSEYNSPQNVISKAGISQPFQDLVRKFFVVEPTRRSSAFEILPSEFLRTDSPVLHQDTLQPLSRGPLHPNSHDMVTLKRRSRHNSSTFSETLSRYATDFTEIGRLGKGGFGEVVKARNKLDGGVYAVKKIRQAQQLLDQVLSEVMLLNRLNHPYVVRYFSTWVETAVFGSAIETDEPSTTNDGEDEKGSQGSASSVSSSSIDFGYQSTGGLDFISSSGYPHIEFGDDSSSGDSDHGIVEVADGTPILDRQSILQSMRASSQDEKSSQSFPSSPYKIPSVLYIQMEYCERQTLRDLVRRGLSTDDAWRYMRQITEGLAHVHSHGIIHRDLKPDNVFIDLAGNPKIGDFGLATTSHHQISGRLASTGSTSGNMTRSVGTALYVAPEVRSSSGVSYTDKVDMFSLGIIFYEMCNVFSTTMERIDALQQLRRKDHQLPSIFLDDKQKVPQGRLINLLISHRPSDRPSSTELLRSDILPLKIEDEIIRHALDGLSDPRSPYHQKMMSALFAHDREGQRRVKALAWDAKGHIASEDARSLRFRGLARTVFETVFRRHGAEEVHRETVFPRSDYYTNSNVVQVLDGSGNVLQLPYDLVLPHARQLARHAPKVKKTFVFGSAYRDAFTVGPPRSHNEVDFDIIGLRLEEEEAFDDAEVVKVADELFEELPFFASTQTVYFHFNHSCILNSILSFCRVSVAQYAVVKETISRLGFHQWDWAKVRAELRKFGLPDTSLEDLSQFDFKDVPEKAFQRLHYLFQRADSRTKSKLDTGIHALASLLETLSMMALRRKVYVSPLGSVNAKFYDDGFLFQCVMERKVNRTVVAAGGRYNSLIEAHRTIGDDRRACQGAVGISIGLDPIVSTMKNCFTEGKGNFVKAKHPLKDESLPHRCDVLLIIPSTEGTRTTGIRLLASLWHHDIGAELALENDTTVDESSYSFVVTVKHEASATVRFKSNLGDSEECDVPVPSLISHIQQEVRESENGKIRRLTMMNRHGSQHDIERKGNVHVLIAQHRSKKSNKYHIVEAAQQRWSDQMDEWKDCAILAIETRDDVIDLIRETRLSEMETWRKVVQSVQLGERQYLGQVQEILSNWRTAWLERRGKKEACIFNFRTGYCTYYDLSL